MMDEIIEKIIKNAKDKTNWKNRMDAIDKMRNYDFPQKRDLIMQMAIHDKVFKVPEKAFRLAQSLGYEKSGKPIFLGTKDIGYKHSDFVKAFKRIRREAKTDNIETKDIKSKLKEIAPEMYDVMKYEKGKNFDEWIDNVYSSLPNQS